MPIPTATTVVSVGALDDYTEVGAPITIPFTFNSSVAVTADATGTTWVDPVTITVTIIDITGATTTLTGGQVTKDSSGHYHVSFTPTNPGLHRGKVTSATPSSVASFGFSALNPRTA